jgi:hypothetical protein
MQKTNSRPESDSADNDFFQQLRRELDHQISGYVYEVPEGAIGSPLPAEQVRGYLNSMRLCLVEARWEEVNICNTSEESWSGVGVKRMCVTMAEDGNYVLYSTPWTSSTT